MYKAYRADVDGLRAVAVAGVVIFHVFPAALPSGFVGVDIFFVISGFLVTSLLAGDHTKARYSILNFYVRRVNRILPALLVVLAVSLAAGWLLLFPDEYQSLARQVASAAVSAANIYFYRVSGYFDTDSATKPLLHLWSLGVEEQFYVLWPFVILLVARRRGAGGSAVITIILGSFAANIVTGSIDRSAQFYLPLSRLWELAAGGLLALQGDRPRALMSPVLRGLASWFGLICMIAALFIIPVDAPYPGWWGLLPVLGASLVIGAGPSSGANRLILSNPVMVGVGLVSYPLYLWHWPLLSFDTIIQGSAPGGIRGAVLVFIALMLSVATYLGLERPLRRRRADKPLAIILVATIVALGSAGLAIAFVNGLPHRPLVNEYTVGDSRFEAVSANSCQPQPADRSLLDLCTAPEGNGEPHVVMYGDSHAWRLYLVLRTAMRSGTIAFYGHTGGGLAAADVPEILAQGSGPGIVNVVSFQPENLGSDKVLPRIKPALAAGHRVVLVLDNPRLPRHPRECIGRPLRGAASVQSCETTIEEQRLYLAEQSQLFELIRSQYPSQVSIVRTTTLFCNDKTCGLRDSQSGGVLYDDAHHLSRLGSGKVVDMMLPYIYGR